MNNRRSVNITRVIDGDTVVILTKQGFFRKAQKERIRLYGIDAPESAQKGGPQSTKHLSRIIGSGKNVWMQSSGIDQYGRTIGLLYNHHGNPNYSYNYQMVEAGHAHAYLVSPADRARYFHAQKEARDHRRGLWKQTNPTPPWEWRKTANAKARAFPWKIVLGLMLIAVVVTWLAPCAGDVPIPFR